MSEQDRPSNWSQAVAAFRTTFLTRPPNTAVVHEGRYWLDDVEVSEPVYYLAQLRKDLPAARARWLQDTGA
jgi:hypothetical protein